VENLSILVPTTKPEKVIHAVKYTISSIYRYWENWKLPPLDIPEALASKLTRVSKIRSTLAELLDNERLRVRCVNTQNQQLSAVINPKASADTLISSICKRIVSQPTIKPTVKHELEEVLGELSEMFEGKLRDELLHI